MAGNVDLFYSVLQTFHPCSKGYLDLFACGAVCKKWQQMVRNFLADTTWGSSFVAGAEIFRKKISSLKRNHDVETIVCGMHMYRVLRDARIQQQAAAALNLVLAWEVNATTRMHTALRTAEHNNAVQAVLAAMAQHPSSKQLLLQSFGVMTSMCVLRRQRNDLFATDQEDLFIHLLDGAMWRFSDDCKFQHAAFNVITKMSTWKGIETYLSPTFKRRILRTDIFKMIIPIMQAHKHKLDEEAGMLLKMLAISESRIWNTVVGPDSIPVILDVLTHSARNDKKQTQHHFLQLIIMILPNPLCMKEFVDNNGIAKCMHAIHACMTLFPVVTPYDLMSGAVPSVPEHDRKTQIYVATILCKICAAKDASYAQAMVNEGGLDLLVDFLRLNSLTDPSPLETVKTFALRALVDMVAFDTTTTMFVRCPNVLPVMPVLLAMMRRDTCTSSLFYRICKLLKKLARHSPAYLRAMKGHGFVTIVQTKPISWRATATCVKLLALIK